MSKVNLTLIAPDGFLHLVQAKKKETISQVAKRISQLEGVSMDLSSAITGVTNWTQNQTVGQMLKIDQQPVFRCDVNLTAKCPKCNQRNVLGYGRLLDPTLTDKQSSSLHHRVFSWSHLTRDYQGKVLYLCHREWQCGQCWSNENKIQVIKKHFFLKSILKLEQETAYQIVNPPIDDDSAE